MIDLITKLGYFYILLNVILLIVVLAFIYWVWKKIDSNK